MMKTIAFSFLFSLSFSSAALMAAEPNWPLGTHPDRIESLGRRLRGYGIDIRTDEHAKFEVWVPSSWGGVSQQKLTSATLKAFVPNERYACADFTLEMTIDGQSYEDPGVYKHLSVPLTFFPLKNGATIEHGGWKIHYGARLLSWEKTTEEKGWSGKVTRRDLEMVWLNSDPDLLFPQSLTYFTISQTPNEQGSFARWEEKDVTRFARVDGGLFDADITSEEKDRLKFGSANWGSPERESKLYSRDVLKTASSRMDICFYLTGNRFYCQGYHSGGFLKAETARHLVPDGYELKEFEVDDESVCTIVAPKTDPSATRVYCKGDRHHVGFSDAPATLKTKQPDLSHIAMGINWGCVVAKGMGFPFCWGDNSYGHGGNIDRAPAIVDPVAMEGGESHAVLLQADGTVRNWGGPGYGYSRLSGEPPALDRPTHIGAIDNRSCAVVRGGIRCWGNHGYLRQGVEDFKVELKDPKQIWVGTYETCVLDGDRVSCHGFSPALAAQMQSLRGVTELRGGEFFVCAKTPTTYKCFGTIRSENFIDKI